MSVHFSVRWPHARRGAALLLSTLALHAGETPAQGLTLPRALARAAQDNPALAAQPHDDRAAQAYVEQAGLRPNPEIGVSIENFAGTGRIQAVRGIETTVEASQTWERGGKRAKRIDAARRDHEAVLKESALRRIDVLAAAATAYVETLAAQQRLTLAEEPLRLARETLDAVTARVRAAAGSPAEAARARAALAVAQADFARANAGLTAARATLAATWGGDASEITAVTGRLQVPALPPDEHALAARLASHPRLELQRIAIAQRRAALALEQAQGVPDVTVGGGVRFLREGSDAGFVARLSVPLPVRNRNQGNIRAARENLAAAELMIRAVETELRTTFAAAWQDLTAAHATVQNLRREALPATEEAYTAVRRAYENGALPIVDVLDAQRALAALHREILEAESAYATALARLDALTDPTFTSLADLLAQP